MILPPRTITSLCIVGDTLHAARVTIGPFGARVAQTARIEYFLSLSEQEAASALRSFSAGRRVVLTVESQWCAIRPIALTTTQWAKARAGVIESIDRLLPIPPAEALVGLMNVYDDDLRPIAGCLIAVRRRKVEPWISAIEAALGARVSTLLTPQMAMLGLGRQLDSTSEFVETASPGDRLRHTLKYGLPVALADQSDRGGMGSAISLPCMDAQDCDVSGEELAIAAAFASFVAPGAFAPLLGPKPTRRVEWAAPAIAAMLTVILAVSAPMILRARLHAGVDRLRTQQASMQESFDTVRTLRRDTERLIQLLDGTASVTENWRSVLPVVAQAQAALPEDSFLYRLIVDERSLTISGETSDAALVLQRLEASPLLESARRTGALVPSSEPGLDLFEMRAERRNRRTDR